ncbi:MAG TPA: hopanoid-associated sugar epimerase [Candidatus Polarisedimenticolaceae bacterium]|nr:hopanoid-associated sugar epimerase [Candidatus Polarisedimenticolaceae bacterium]
MPNLVTGGTGFIGAHVVRALLARGREVRCLVRPGTPRDNLAGLPVEIAAGDLNDAASLARACAGADIVYHVAADYRLYARDPREIYRVNVEGTRSLLRAAGEAGVTRFVHTSSVGALGLTKDGSPADETTPVTLDQVVGHYKRSKFLAEREAEAAAAAGLPVVIVNPSTPIGEYDIKPTPTGQVIVDFLARRMPAYVRTGLNLVDAKDVAEGHLLAAERGRVGERYILGHRNMTLKEMLDLLAEITGLPAPRVRVPHALPLFVGAIDTTLARLTGRVPRVPLEAVRMSRKIMFFDAGKAVRELSLPQTDVAVALRRAVDWFRARPARAA